MKIIYRDGMIAECPQEDELHVLRHTAAHIHIPCTHTHVLRMGPQMIRVSITMLI